MKTTLMLRALVTIALGVLATGAAAQVMPAPAAEVPMLDPYVPPGARPKSLRVPAATQGPALEAQVERKLRTRFEAAAQGQPTLTREQARAAGLGAITREFDVIDRSRRGAITFEDYQRHLQEARAPAR